MSETAVAASKRARAEPVEKAPRKRVQILPDKLQLAEHTFMRWFGVVPSGTLPEDLDGKPEACVLITDMMHKGDDLRLFTADDKLMIDCVCVRAQPGYTVLRVVQSLVLPDVRLDELSSRIPFGFEIRLATSGDRQPGWLVWRLPELNQDGTRPGTEHNILLNGGHHFETQEQATRYLLDHASVRGNAPQGVWS